jgi:hypothetical protein
LDDNITNAVNYDNLHSNLEYLASNSDLKITTLSGPISATFEKTKRQMELLSGLSIYSTIVDSVKEKFSGKKVYPQTIGSYFVGCISSAKIPESFPKECSPICMGNLTEGGKVSKCSERVITSRFTTGGYNFTDVNGYGGNSYAVIFVPLIPAFEGFADGERNVLASMGVQNGTVYTGYPNGDIAEVGKMSDTRRIREIKVTGIHQTSGSSAVLAFLVLIAAIFLIVFIIAYKRGSTVRT